MENRRLSGKGNCVILPIWENHKAKAALPLFFIRRVQVALQTKERRDQVFIEIIFYFPIPVKSNQISKLGKPKKRAT